MKLTHNGPSHVLNPRDPALTLTRSQKERVMANPNPIKCGVAVVALILLGVAPAWAWSDHATATSSAKATATAEAYQYQYQHQEQNQKQGQSQVNQPDQTVAPSQSVKIDVPHQAPAMYAPALTSAGQNVCLGSVSFGVSIPWAGASFGTTKVDKGCERRNNAALLHQFGRPEAALRLLMLDDEVREALNPSAGKVALPTQDMLPPMVNRPWEPVSVRREGP